MAAIVAGVAVPSYFSDGVVGFVLEWAGISKLEKHSSHLLRL
jgi:hypothetical protein